MVLKIFQLFRENNLYKIDKSLQLLGLNVKGTEFKKIQILNKISKYLFKSGKNRNSLQTKNFDLDYDYRFYYVDFLEYGIDLNDQDIDWWKFENILNGILLKDNTVMSKVMSYRLYEKPSKNQKSQEEKEHKRKMELKRKYALPFQKNTMDGFEKMWNYVEKKAGDNKE